MAKSSKQKTIRVVQISDSHLFQDTEAKLLGVSTQYSFDLVVDLVRAEQPDVDLFLCTGDLSQDGSVQAYERFNDTINTFKKPSYWLPGNHDKVPVMRSVLQDDSRISPCIVDLGDWQIIMLDCSIEDDVPGRLEDDQLRFLDQSLAEMKDKHVMVCLHHHPVNMESEWLDGVALLNPDDFFAITDRYSQIKTIVWGHVHQHFECLRKGVRLFALPSTCVQFKPKSKEFAVDDKSPGYRWFDLFPDGRIETGVSRVIGVVFDIDYSVKGY